MRLGLLLKAHTRPGARIAHFWAGAAPYFSERPALDMLGKSDRHVARLRSSAEDYQPGHNKYDAPYSLGLKPDVVVAGIRGQLIIDPQAMATEPARKNYPGLFLPLESKEFREDYSKQIIKDPLSLDFHGIFVRTGSSLADPPEQWREGPGKY